jgi:hypothetical protein
LYKKRIENLKKRDFETRVSYEFEQQLELSRQRLEAGKSKLGTTVEKSILNNDQTRGESNKEVDWDSVGYESKNDVTLAT